MRSAGKLACFRSNISHRDGPGHISRHGGTVCLKLFNLLLKDLGPGFLSRGVLIPVGKIGNFLQGFSSEDWQDCGHVSLNGNAIDPADLSRTDWQGEMIELQVAFG
jgi:hypothetical protein